MALFRQNLVWCDASWLSLQVFSFSFSSEFSWHTASCSKLGLLLFVFANTFKIVWLSQRCMIDELMKSRCRKELTSKKNLPEFESQMDSSFASKGLPWIHHHSTLPEWQLERIVTNDLVSAWKKLKTSTKSMREEVSGRGGGRDGLCLWSFSKQGKDNDNKKQV